MILIVGDFKIGRAFKRYQMTNLTKN